MNWPGSPLSRMPVREWPFKVRSFEDAPASGSIDVERSSMESSHGVPVVRSRDSLGSPSQGAQGDPLTSDPQAERARQA